MKSILLIIGVLVSFAGVRAAETNCGGRVVWVMADHSGCGGFLAFKTEGSGGKSGVWMCTKSKDGGALVMAASVSGIPILAHIEVGDVGGVCTQLPWYRQVAYVILDN